jgi:trehalose 6-phosphate synthase
MRRMREIVRDNNVYRWAGSMLLDAARLRKRGDMERVMARHAQPPGNGSGDSPGDTNVVSMFRRTRAAAL